MTEPEWLARNDVRQAADAALLADTIGRLASRIRIESILPLCQLLRDIFNPCRPVTIDPAWQTAQVRFEAAFGSRRAKELRALLHEVATNKDIMVAWSPRNDRHVEEVGV